MGGPRSAKRADGRVDQKELSEYPWKKNYPLWSETFSTFSRGEGKEA